MLSDVDSERGWRLTGAVRVTPALLDDADDVRQLAELRARWAGRSMTDRFSYEFAVWLESESASRLAWFAEDDRGARCGMVTLKVFSRMPSPERPSSSWGYLANLFVLEEFRGRGAGGQLVATVIEGARAAGMVRLVLAPSELSIPLYRRYGFDSAEDLLLLRL